MEFNREQMKKIALLLGGSILFFWTLNNLEYLKGILNTFIGVIFPFSLGLCIAFVLSVPMRGFERLLFRPRKKTGTVRLEKLKQPICLLLAVLTILLILAAVTFLVLPELGRTAITIKDSIPTFVTQVQQWSSQMLEEYPEILTTIQGVNWNNIWDGVFGFLKSGVGSVVGSAVGAIGSVFNGATAVCLAVIFAFYVLIQRKTLIRQIKRFLYAHIKEERVDRALEISALTNRTFSNYITGQCLEAVILGTMFFIAMNIFRFPYALMISVLIAFLALIPLFGAFIGCAVGAILILISDPIQAFWFVVLFLVIQQIEGNFIYPRVVGSSVGLPGIWVLVAVTIGGSAFGILGMLVMVPLGSVIYSLTRERTAKRLRERKTPTEKIT